MASTMEENQNIASMAAASIHKPTRLRFAVELEPNQTTVVSWKKLLKESQQVGQDHPSMKNPNKSDPNPCNRLGSVIEKIERLYQGVDSSEEEQEICEENVEYYDSADSFIDDSELNDYFSMGNATKKYSGFYIHRGTLEIIKEPCSDTTPPRPPPPKKKKKKTKISMEEVPNKVKTEKKRSKLKPTEMKEICLANQGVNAVEEGMDVTCAEFLGGESSKNKVLGSSSNNEVKLSVLDKAFVDLEKSVAECGSLPQHSQASEGPKKASLPPDVRKKFKEVGRLALAENGKIPDKVVHRLISILGHIMQPKSLKCNLRRMTVRYVEAQAQQKKPDAQAQEEKPAAEPTS